MEKKKETKIESLERKYRRHEVTFSAIQGNENLDYLENYIYNHTSQSSSDFADKMVAKIDKRVMQRALMNLPNEDRNILTAYLLGTQQNEIANNLGVSPSAINQRLEKIIYNYRVILCNDKEFIQTSHWDSFNEDAEYLFAVYLKEVRKQGTLKIDFNEIKQLIKDTRKAISHSITTKSNISIREQLSKQIDYSSLDNKYINDMNKAFAEQGIEAHFERLKTFKGNIVQVLKMVDDFIDELENQTYQKIERWHFGIDNTKLLNLVLSGKKKATCYLYKDDKNLPRVGDMSIITRFDGKDACLLQTEDVNILAFNEVTWDMAKLEGEYKNIEDWKREHLDFFRNEYRDFKENTLIVFEKFKVLKNF